MTVKVFVLDRRKNPLMPCSPKRARELLSARRAVVHKIHPFTIRLKDRLLEDSSVQPVSVKVDPGSKKTGVALTRTDEDAVEHALAFFVLEHRGSLIHEKMEARRALRRGRRSRNLRYRAKRFLNRTKPEGWLAPSLRHRVDTTVSFVKKLQSLVPIVRVSQELVKFDTQVLEKPDIKGKEYQQGTLAGYEVREYLLEKWGRRCAYCGKENVPLEVEHIEPKAHRGTNRISNLTLACRKCNERKGARSVEEFLRGKPEILKRINAQRKAPLKDTAAVNATRWALFNELKTILPIETGSGGLTKFNRNVFGVRKEHWLDALCVGRINGIDECYKELNVLNVKCTGRGAYKRTRCDKNGFPRGLCLREKRVHGFATGDMVKAQISEGKKKGIYTGRVKVRKTGSFAIQTRQGLVDGVSYRYCTRISINDGYGYSWPQHRTALPPPAEAGGLRARL